MLVEQLGEPRLARMREILEHRGQRREALLGSLAGERTDSLAQVIEHEVHGLLGEGVGGSEPMLLGLTPVRQRPR